MRTFILALLFLPVIGFAEEVRVATGMSRDDVVAVIKKYSGEDITAHQEVLSRDGKTVVSGLYWAFRDYDAVIELQARDGKVTKIGFWERKDFGENKLHRAKTEQNITVLKLDTKTKGVSVEKK